jgi:ABC-type multidrug transport system fused ATPase/permease subunit
MVNLRNVLQYYRSYWSLSLFSISASSLFEVIDLAVPYSIGQLLNFYPISRLTVRCKDSWSALLPSAAKPTTASFG